MAAEYNLDSAERQMKFGIPSNETILQQLRSGIANFEIAASPVASLSGQCGRFLTSSAAASPGFFARIGNPVSMGSPAMKKVERYSVRKVTGDGLCLFRALVKGMAINKGMRLGLKEEKKSADALLMAVKKVICDNEKEHFRFEEALVAINSKESRKSYCQRIGTPDFWGGEPELLVLSKLCCQPIVVYIPEHEHGGRGTGFIPIEEYGSEFHKGSEQGKQKAVRLLYTGRNHYDLLCDLGFSPN